MSYIERDLKAIVKSASNEYACVLVTGPRQVGKTTLLQHLDKDRLFVTLDDLELRALARRDPEFFLQTYPAPVLIDEAQYAPELFPYLKMAADAGAAPGSFWLTGSQSFRMSRLAQESLAGRVAIFHMCALSQHELYGSGKCEPLSLSIDALRRREQSMQQANTAELFRRIWAGQMPGHVGGRFNNREVFYGSYVDTYIERDVAEEIPGVDRLRFRDFVRAAACRVGQLLNVHDIARDVDIADNTAKRWLAVLERSEIAYLLRPYSNNLLTRTVKAPKLYFFDTGLVAYLTRYSSPEVLQSGALAGELFENYVVNEVRKGFANSAIDPLLWYYRDTNAKEIDLVLEADGELHPLEVKKSASPASRATSAFRLLDKASTPRGMGGVVCMKPAVTPVDRTTLLIPAWVV